MDTRKINARRIAIAAGAVALGVVGASPAHASTSSSQPSAGVANGTLTVLGTRGADAITVAGDPADATKLVVDLGDGAPPQTFDRTTFGTISVFLRWGDDSFQVLPGGSLADERLVVRGGAGDDTIVGGDGGDRMFGGPGDDDLQGRDGVDLMFGARGNDAVNGNRGDDIEFLGRGLDTALWIPGEGSDDIAGGRGYDTLAFDGSDGDEEMRLTANGEAAVFFRNLGSIRMDLDSVEALDLAALGGADEVTVDDLAGTDMRSADIDLASTAGTPDAALDTVTVNGGEAADRIDVDADKGAVEVSGLTATTHISGADARDQLAVNGLGGNDRIDVSDAARALMTVTVDLGAGQH